VRNMGGVCCCFSPDDFEDYNVAYPTGSVYQNCFCLRHCVQWFLQMVIYTPFIPFYRM